ncbi:type II toxin-antitoxin system HicB family antitoxin [Dyella sp.]|uniref:type II toxin-antitoxin system HicB family antitoxin n=1 Tax=Dyella sp. TaxID=1869338 RepID=UPI002FDB57D1
MYYPVYVFKDPGSAYGAAIPDMPGVNSAADELEDLPAMVQEAVELMYEGEESGPAPASTIERWKDDPEYQGGFWLMLDIDLSKISTKAVRLNISLPEYLVHRIDSVAKSRHLSRSSFIAMAAEHEMAREATNAQH